MPNQLATITAKTSTLANSSFYSDGLVKKTPLLHSAILSNMTGYNVYLKCENLQTTGSFKIRGAVSALLNLSPEQKEKGVITASSGNHGAATATAAKTLGIPVTIYVPESISPTKEEKIVSAGAQLVKVPGSSDQAEQTALRIAKQTGQVYLSPYNHIDIIAGQGSIAAEIFTTLADVDQIFTSVGGGGLISGLGANIKAANPQTQVIGCWPEQAPAMLKCMEAGDVIEVEEYDTISDGTAGGVEPGAMTLPLCQQVISSTITVSEEEIKQAMALIFTHHDFMIEGAAGVAVAGLLKATEKNPNKHSDKNLVVVLCGQNIEKSTFSSILKTAKAL